MKLNRIILALVFAVTAGTALAASDPSSQARALYTAIHKQNWRALYYLAAFSPAIRKQLKGGPDKFASDVQKGIDSGGNAKVVGALFASIKTIQVSKATVNGNKATVPTSADITVSGKTKHFKGIAKMIKDGGVWKWDLSYSDDVQKATSDSLQALIGKPTN